MPRISHASRKGSGKYMPCVLFPKYVLMTLRRHSARLRALMNMSSVDDGSARGLAFCAADSFPPPNSFSAAELVGIWQGRQSSPGSPLGSPSSPSSSSPSSSSLSSSSGRKSSRVSTWLTSSDPLANVEIPLLSICGLFLFCGGFFPFPLRLRLPIILFLCPSQYWDLTR